VRKLFHNIEAVFADTGARKTAAAKSRANVSSSAAEPSRDVYLNACRQIAEAFAGDGYKFAKSGPHFTKKDDPFIYCVSSQSSHNNIPGQHVVLWMHAWVRSPKLANWRRRQPHPHRDDDYVAGGMVHLLNRKHAMIEWELADISTRKATIEDAVRFVRSDVFPYFQKFSDPTALILELHTKNVAEFGVASSVEFALCFGSPEQAQRILDRYIAQRPDLRNQIEQSTQTFLREGFPEFFATSYADQVAWVRTAYDLK
jgi:hypothetical protein